MISDPRKLLSNALIFTPTEKVISSKELFDNSDIIAFYFSGSWCIPCQKFDSQLKFLKSELMKSFKKTIEFVLISSDKCQEECEKHAKSLDINYLSYDLYIEKKRLCRLYNVSNLPQLTVINSITGEVINRNIRNAVESNWSLNTFPWKQELFHDVLFCDDGVQYFGDKTKKILPSDLLDNKICILFSANWCPPCKKMLPLLASTVEKSEHLNRISVIYINFDQRSNLAAGLSEAVVDDDYAKNERDAEFKMPDNWITLSSGCSTFSRAEQLAHIVGVSRIPHMCIIEPGHLTDTSHMWTNVVPLLMADPDWLLCGSLSIQILTAATLEMMISIDKALVAIVWLKEDVSVAFEFLQELSTSAPNFKVHYYVGWDGDTATRYLRSLLEIGDQSPMLIHLDFENESFSICPRDELQSDNLFGSKRSVLDFIERLESGNAIETLFPPKARIN